MVKETDKPTELFCEQVEFHGKEYKVEVKPWMGNVPHLFVNDRVTAYVHRPWFDKETSIKNAIIDYLG